MLSIILGIVLILLALLAVTAIMLGRMPMPGGWSGGALLFAVLTGAGCAAGVRALRALATGNIRQAACYALVAVVLPPPNLIMLLAGGLLYIESRGPVTAAATSG